jgi:hypothetical protein
MPPRVEANGTTPIGHADLSNRWIRVSDNATLEDLTGFDGIIAKTMRRKRLQHVADTMCQMFCGWRLIESKPNLLKLGSGTLEIDAVTGQCVFQGETTGQLTIAEEIRAWLQQDLATNKIPIAALTGLSVLKRQRIHSPD